MNTFAMDVVAAGALSFTQYQAPIKQCLFSGLFMAGKDEGNCYESAREMEEVPGV